MPVVLGTVFLLLLPSAALGAGQLDPTFDGDGKVVTDLGESEGGGDVAVQADGKIVVVGGIRIVANGPVDFAVARYNADGSLDTTFAGDGSVVTDLGGDDSARDVAIQADGKIVAAGYTDPGGDFARNFALTRYNPDGSLDTSFDGDGKVVTDFGGTNDEASAVAVQAADGKIVAAGTTVPGVHRFDFALARYNADGSLDPSFDGDGRVTTDFAKNDFDEGDFANALAIRSDGKILAVGFTGTANNPRNFALARYNPDGSLDPVFSDDGKVMTDFGAFDDAHDVAIQADGKMVVAGRSSAGPNGYNFALARYNRNGGLDTTFDGDGKVLTDFGDSDEARSVAIQADGKIVATGESETSSTLTDFSLARYNPDGSLDTSFDGDGRVQTDFGEFDGADGVAIQADGKIVAAGVTTAGPDTSNTALARYVAASPSISISDAARLEGNAGVTTFMFTVSLSAPSSQTITVTRQTADGSAIAPSDYMPLGAATFTFSPGQTTKTAVVKVNGDVAVEPNETFFVNLSNPTNATIADGQGRGTIMNDDLSDSVPCTITGTKDNDVLSGTPGNDVICGGRGDDEIYGLGGNDVLKGESGNDLLVGGIGYDLLVGDVGSDDLRGEDGNDTLRGGDRDDTVNGGAGSDALFGDAGADSLYSQDGVSANDSADGGSDTDSCVFDSGDFVTSCP